VSLNVLRADRYVRSSNGPTESAPPEIASSASRSTRISGATSGSELKSPDGKCHLPKGSPQATNNVSVVSWSLNDRVTRRSGPDSELVRFSDSSNPWATSNSEIAPGTVTSAASSRENRARLEKSLENVEFDDELVNGVWVVGHNFTQPE